MISFTPYLWGIDLLSAMKVEVSSNMPRLCDYAIRVKAKLICDNKNGKVGVETDWKEIQASVLGWTHSASHQMCCSFHGV